MSNRFQPVTYPGSVPELTPNLPTNELIRRLKMLFEALREIDQDHNEAAKYKSLAIHLSSEFLMQNQSREIRIYDACCIAEILRIFAPDAPYGDPHQLKTVLMFLIKQLRGLDNEKDPLFVQYFCLLENLAVVKTLNIVLELEESQEFIIAMLKLFFAILQSDDVSAKVQGMLMDILVCLIKECDHLSVPALDALLINLIEPHKTQSRIAYRCAREVIEMSSGAIQPFIESYLLTTIADGKNAESELREFIFEIIFEIHSILSQALSLVWVQLEERIKSSETKDRMDTVRLLSRLFADKDSTVYQECPSLFSLFMARFNDINPEIRLQCLKASVELMLNHVHLRNDIENVVVHRFRDTDDNVRMQAITTFLNAAKKDFSVVTDQIMNCIKDRTLDRKSKVRREAVLCLGCFYRKMITNTSCHVYDIKRTLWIRNKLLHMYYQQNLEDRILCEKVLSTCLVPFIFDTKQRMDQMFHIYAAVDDNASKAFNEIFRQQSRIRHILRNILQCDSTENPAEAAENQLNRLKQLSEFFMDPRALDHLKSFYDYLVDDAHLLKLMLKIMSDDYTTDEIQSNLKAILTKVGPGTKLWHLHGTVRNLLERSAPILVDKAAIEYLVSKVSNFSPEIRSEFGLDDDLSLEQIEERGYQLLLLLSSSFPAAFCTQNTLSMLLTMLQSGNQLAVNPIIRIFTLVGRQSGAEFDEIYNQLLPELKKIAISGSEKQAKHSIVCMDKLWPNDLTILEEIYDEVLKNVDVRNPGVQAAFATLSSIARLKPDEFHEKLRSIISGKTVKDIILNDDAHSDYTPGSENDRIWTEAGDLSIECRAKIAASKFLVYRLMGMKSNKDNHASNTIKLLNGIIESGGNLQAINMRYADKAHLRLQAGCYFLKLLREKMFVELMGLRHYTNLCYLICDECPQVREKFAAKLHKNLYSLRLPLEMVSAFPLVPLIKPLNAGEEKDLIRFKTQVRDSILLNYRRRKDYLRKNPTLQSFPWKYLPEYYITSTVYLLAHYKQYASIEDVDVLREIRECLWFALEPMVNRKDADKANPQFLFRIFQDMKHTRDAQDPDDLDLAEKIWALCDLGMILLMHRTPNFDDKPLQYKALLPKKFFSQPKKGRTITNTKEYLPSELFDEERRRQRSATSVATSSRSRAALSSSAKARQQNGIASPIEINDQEPAKGKKKRRVNKRKVVVHDDDDSRNENADVGDDSIINDAA